jgi:hypothetical protein
MYNLFPNFKIDFFLLKWKNNNEEPKQIWNLNLLEGKEKMK